MPCAAKALGIETHRLKNISSRTINQVAAIFTRIFSQFSKFTTIRRNVATAQLDVVGAVLAKIPHVAYLKMIPKIL